VTALTSVKLSLTYLEERNGKVGAPGPNLTVNPEKSVLILCPSPTQGRLIRAFIEDLSEEKLNILSGEPIEFENFPPASLVILDTALISPHTTHPYAKGRLAKQNLIRALSLADGALVIVGDEEKLLSLPKDGPLGALFNKATDKVHYDGRLTGIETSIQDALDMAGESVFAALPAMSRGWWPALGPYFHNALKRKIDMVILAALPEGDEDREYPGNAIRELRIAGAKVILSEGFPDFLSIIDNKLFSWGSFPINPSHPNKILHMIRTISLPKAAKVLSEAMQLSLLSGKLSGIPIRSCPSCGWPFLLINQDRLRDFGDQNSLKLGCLNESCPNHKRPRPLDERWPFQSPPLCELNHETQYQRTFLGKSEYWVCPTHPDGNPCPKHKVIPGDPKRRGG
jgi:hypothetical protein